jgi:hypothetical protein
MFTTTATGSYWPSSDSAINIANPRSVSSLISIAKPGVMFFLVAIVMLLVFAITSIRRFGCGKWQGEFRWAEIAPVGPRCALGVRVDPQDHLAGARRLRVPALATAAKPWWSQPCATMAACRYHGHSCE